MAVRLFSCTGLSVWMGEKIMTLNESWEQRLKENGVDFVHFVDAAVLPGEVAKDYSCAVLFGKLLSKEYIRALRAGEKPKRREFGIFEQKMDSLAVKLAEWLEADGYESVAKLKFGTLPHKTIALRAGMGFIGKNNLLVTEEYGCAVTLGKVLTKAPFSVTSTAIREPQCGECSVPRKPCTGKLGAWAQAGMKFWFESSAPFA